MGEDVEVKRERMESFIQGGGFVYWGSLFGFAFIVWCSKVPDLAFKVEPMRQNCFHCCRFLRGF